MNPILLALSWAGAAGRPFNLEASLVELGVAVLLTAGVAGLARRNDRDKRQLLERELAAAVPVGGIH